MRKRLALACVALACAAATFAAPLKPGALREYVTPGFTLVSDDEYEARRLLRRVPSFERLLAKFLDCEPRPTGTPTYIYLVRGTVWSRYLQPSHSVIGEFVPARFASYILMATGTQRVRQSLLHEYTHYFLHSQFRGFYPLWFDEGLAGLMESTVLRETYARVDVPSFVAQRPWIAMPRLLTIDKSSREYLQNPLTGNVHGMSWALVHRGFVDDKKFGASILSYLRAINDLVPIEDAVQSSFGMSVASLDESMRTYLDRGRFYQSRIDFEPVTPAPAGAGRLLGAAEAYEAVARAMLDTGFNPQRLREVIDAAAAAAPGSPSVGVLRARLASRDRDDAALDSLHDAWGPGADARTARGLGLALFERLRGPAGDERMPEAKRLDIEARAFALLERALAADAGDAEPAWAFALLAVHRRERLDVALQRLELAKQRVRDNADLALATALVHQAREDPAAELAALVDAARFSGSIDERAAIVRRARELRSELRATAPQ